MPFQIRKSKEIDIPQIINLIREFAEFEKLSPSLLVTEENLLDAIFGERRFVECFVASYENETVGYALGFPVFKTFRGERSFYVEDIYVREDFRGLGLGLMFFEELAGFAKTSGCARMDWQALQWNDKAIKFYKNIGAESDDENLDFRLRGAAFERLAA